MNATPGIAIRIKQKKIITAFLSNDCTSIEKAKSIDELGLRESHTFNKLESKGVFVKCDGGKYFFDKKAWDHTRKTRLIFIAAAIIIVLVLVLTNVL